MNNNIDGIFHPNHDRKGIEKKEQPKDLTGWFVDDQEDFFEFINSSTEDVSGLKISFFNRSDNAFEEIKKGNKPDFLIIDGNLEGGSLSGDEFIEKIKKTFSSSECPIIFTFTSDPNKEKLMLEKGADMCLNKNDLLKVCNDLSNIEELKNNLEKIKAKRNYAEI